MSLPSRIPGIVASVDRARREVRVKIPGLTDGAEQFPIAEFEYPIGDKSEHTEIRVLPNDRVWLAFRNGDPRYPIITGYRPKQTGNVLYHRRWHHDNIDIEADDGDITETASQDIVETAVRDIHASAGRHALVEAEDQVGIFAGTTMDLEAGTQMRLKVGGSTITLTTSAIVIVTTTEAHTVPLATFSALVQVAGLLSANGGLAALGAGGGAGATISGGMQVTGGTTSDTVSASGEITAHTGSTPVTVGGHVHSNPEGGVVGPATG